LFNGPSPEKEEVLALHNQLHKGNIDVYDYVIGTVSFGQDDMAALYIRITEEIANTFKRSSLSNYMNRKSTHTLVIMRYVVINMQSVGWKFGI
jgi:hypothetical protein